MGKEDFDFNFDFDKPKKKKDIVDAPPQIDKKDKRRKTECIELSTRFLYKRAHSEMQLLDAIGLNLEKGKSYMCITSGDVDTLSYLKVVLRHQRLEHVLFSTWCMAAEDVLQFKEWIQEGKIKRLDAYVGEIFPSTYHIEYKMLKDLFEKHDIGRIAVFKNHSKIFAGTGDKFAFSIQTSANINTNPRTENGIIVIDQEGESYQFHKDYFDGIVSFDKDNHKSF